ALRHRPHIDADDARHQLFNFAEKDACNGACSLVNDFASSSSSPRCFAVRLVGVSTVTRTCASPRPPDFKPNPLPRNRNKVPDCVPGGTRISTGPSSVG